MNRRSYLAVLGTAATVGLAGCRGIDEDVFTLGTDTDSDWPMPRYDPTNTAFAPDAAGPRADVTERWRVTIGFDARTPAIVDGTVYLPTAEALVALDAANGSERWRFAPERQPWPAPPVVHDGTVYVTMSDEDSVHALDAQTGEERWSLSEFGHAHASPHLLAGEIVNEPPLLVGGENGRLRALDPVTGETRWEIDLFGTITEMMFDGRRLCVGTAGGEVYAFGLSEPEPPRELWRRKVGGQVEGVVGTSNGIAVATFGGPLVNLDGVRAGTTRWTAPEKHAGSPPVYAGSWFFSTGWDSLSALRTYDENLGWRASAEFGQAAPVAAGDTIYAPGEREVHAFDLSGGSLTAGPKRWSHPVPSGGIQGLAVADGALFVACESGEDDEPTLVCLESP